MEFGSNDEWEIYIHMPGYKILSAGPAFAQLVGRFAAARHEGKATDHTSMQPMSYGSYFYATDECRYLCKDLPFSRSNQIYLRNKGDLNIRNIWVSTNAFSRVQINTTNHTQI